MICLPERQRVVQLLDEAMLAGARQKPACAVLGLSVRTLQRWQEHDTVPGDARLCRQFEPANKLSQAERDALLGLANSAEFGHLPPSQIVPRLAERGEYVASESTFYRVLRAHHQLAHRHANRESRSAPRHAPCVRRRQISSIAGTSPTCPRACAERSFTSTFFWTSLAARSWAGRSTRKRAVSWPPSSYARSAERKISLQAKSFCIRTTALP